MKAIIWYFSGTGNTERAANLIKSELQNNAISTCIRSIEKNIQNPSENPVEAYDLTIICFPTYAFTAPAIVQQFLSKMNFSKYAAVYTTFGGDPFGSANEIARKLQRNGYQILSVGGGLFPDNWTHVMNPASGEKANEMLKSGEASSTEFGATLAAKLLAQSDVKNPDATKKGRFIPYNLKPWLNFSLSILGFLFLIIGRRLLGLTYFADSTCTGCTLCEKACPVKNIHKASTKNPVWGLSCEECNRCINLCPLHSVNCSNARLTGAAIIIAILTAISIAIYQPLTLVLQDVPGVLIILVLLVVMHILFILAQFHLVNPLIRQLEIKYRKKMDFSFSKKFDRYVFKGFKPFKD